MDEVYSRRVLSFAGRKHIGFKKRHLKNAPPSRAQVDSAEADDLG